MSNIVILGSTGSIGKQTLEVCRMHNISVKALSADRNTVLLEQQAREFHPEYVCVYSESSYPDMKHRLSDTDIKVVWGMEGLCRLAALPCDTVVNSVVGMVGLLPTLEAAKAGNDIALANKETLVAGGALVTDCVKQNGVKLLPIDSEHSAIFQCLMGAGDNRPEKILLTASGGPFYGWTTEQLRGVTVEQALRHPNWSMGAKITIDSATLMNKGLELIEAVRLFDVKPEQVEIVVHRQSIIHSAVEFSDGAVIAQLGTADMRIPIQLALTYPQRLPSPAKRLSLADIGELTFGRADEQIFTCLSAAKKAISLDGNAPCAVNSANEAAVALFLQKKIGFLDIGEAVNGALETVKYIEKPTLEDILDTKSAAEEYVAARFGG
ncbi:MAG: 1-deoxy-D-xylulose-5-phosphate reductoisomerase [Oscillospiraceae bacterium]